MPTRLLNGTARRWIFHSNMKFPELLPKILNERRHTAASQN